MLTSTRGFQSSLSALQSQRRNTFAKTQTQQAQKVAAIGSASNALPHHRQQPYSSGQQHFINILA
jgi:hypothetical protein